MPRLQHPYWNPCTMKLFFFFKLCIVFLFTTTEHPWKIRQKMMLTVSTFSQSDYALCGTVPGEAGWSCLRTGSHCCHPCFSAFSIGGWSIQEALFSHPAFPHLCLSRPWILFKNNGSKEGQPVKVLTTKPEDLSSGLSTHIMEGENWLLSTCTQTYAKLIDAMFLIVRKGQKPEIEKKRNCDTRASMFLSPLYAQSSYNNRDSPSHNILLQDFGSPSLVYQNKISHLQLKSSIRDWWNWKQVPSEGLEIWEDTSSSKCSPRSAITNS